MKKQPISLEEQKRIRYEILEEVDKYCRENEIKYSLAFGTLLGAIRHKGFIPWDDDLDIMMPLPDMLRFKKGFHSDKIKFYDIDTDSDYRCAFGNLGYISTYRRSGLISRFFGVGVDVYPLIGLPEDITLRESFFAQAETLQCNRMKFLKWQQRFLKILPIYNIPGYSRAIRTYRDFLYNNSVPYEKSTVFYVIAAPLSDRKLMTYDCDLFENLIEVPFETGIFKCIEHYDYFLTKKYGDYMKLPPLEERVEHHGQIYYRK